MACSCTICVVCNGSGNIWLDMRGRVTVHCDDLDEMEICEDCGGSGTVEICDECQDARDLNT